MVLDIKIDLESKILALLVSIFKVTIISFEFIDFDGQISF